MIKKDKRKLVFLFRQKKHQALPGDELAVQTTRFATIYK